MVNKIEQCPACNSLDVREAISADNNARKKYLAFSRIKYESLLDDWLNEIELVINNCKNCNHHWYLNQPCTTMLKNMYAAGKPLHATNSKTILRTPSGKMISEMKKLKKLVREESPKLLDYGSGFGRWARAGAEVGFKVTAYEPTEERGGEEEKDIGFTLLHDTASLKGQKFDAVNLEQVLEHIPEPFQVLKEIYEYCAPDAVVRVTVPNILHCPEGTKIWSEWPFNGHRVHTMAPFEHLHGFTPLSLLKLSKRAGFETVFSPQFFRCYPISAFRRLLRIPFPRLGQTFLVLRPKNVNYST
jgi:2-polyprenyl-3-methyl-5-hydroxy-6-metoxy-1,4-benzoquinol methylase